MPKKGATCYMCDDSAVSREHAPPICFFPEKGGFRDSNLITVDSCNAHNSEKNGHDEYFRFLAVVSPGANRIALSLVEGPVGRSWQGKRRRMLQVFFPNFQERPADPVGPASFTADVEKFQFSLEALVRALHFKAFKTKLLCPLTWSWGAIRSPDLQENVLAVAIRRHAPPVWSPIRGVDPRVFKFGFAHTGDYMLCRVQFYDGEPMFVFWAINDVPEGQAQYLLKK